MQDFIVLGLIPGTHFQLNFIYWLYIASSLVVLSFLLIYRHKIRAAWLGWRVARLINRNSYLQ